LLERQHAALASAGVDARAHIRAINDNRELSVGEEALVVLASVFKIAVALELFRQAARGRLDLTERLTLAASARTPGPTGISAMQDDVELSLRDLAFQMLVVSDNAATDAIIARVGLDAIHATLRSLGLRHTTLVGDCRDLLTTMAADAGADSWEELLDAAARDPEWAAEIRARLERSRALQAEATSRTTPREQTKLLRAIWRDAAGPPDACAAVRSLMRRQASRFTRSFAAEARVSAKSGSAGGIVANEVGVVELARGPAFAVAVFTRARPDTPPNIVDDGIASLARLGVDVLLAQRPRPVRQRAPRRLS
jgi:beta-lactamase class A